MTFLEIQLKTGLVKLEFAQLSGDNVVFLHFTPVGKLTLSAYREWKLRFKEILELCSTMGAVEVLSFVPSNKPQALELQKKFGFEVIDYLPEGILTRCAHYGD